MNKDLIEKARKERQAVILEPIDLNLPQWNDFIKHFFSSLRKTDYLSGYDNSVGQVIFYDSGTLSVGSSEDFLPEAKIFQKICKDLSGINGGVATLINLCKDNVTGKHNDPMDWLYIQCIGSTTWMVGLDNEDVAYTLNPGDALFLPKKLFHAVYNNTDLRAGLIFSCTEKENVCND